MRGRRWAVFEASVVDCDLWIRAIEVSSRSPTFYGFSLGENDAKCFEKCFIAVQTVLNDMIWTIACL